MGEMIPPRPLEGHKSGSGRLADLIIGMNALLLTNEFDLTLRRPLEDIITECTRLYYGISRDDFYP